MKKHLVMLSVLVLQAVAVSLFAQDMVGHEYVDLGLSVKWATCNIGADKPEDYGDFFAWGETEPYYSSLSPLVWKEGHEGGYCDGNSYFDYDSNLNPHYRKYRADGKTVLAPEDDAAHVNWGGEWRMPTIEEWKELCDSCIWTWTTVNSGPGVQIVNGYRIRSNVQGYTDRTIFIPAAGYCSRGNHVVGSFNRYWSSSLHEIDSRIANNLYFTSARTYMECMYRDHGFPIRPVCPK